MADNFNPCSMQHPTMKCIHTKCRLLRDTKYFDYLFCGSSFSLTVVLIVFTALHLLMFNLAFHPISFIQKNLLL